MARQSKEASATQAADLITGTEQNLGTVTQVTFSGQAFTPAEIEAQLSELVTLRTGVNATKAAYEKAVATENARRPALLVFMDEYVGFIRSNYGNDQTVLATFGLPPKKAPAALTVDEKAAAVAKREATREARHTMGPKARLTDRTMVWRTSS